LREALKNKKAQMVIAVEEANNTNERNACYMPEDKMKFLVEKHPQRSGSA